MIFYCADSEFINLNVNNNFTSNVILCKNYLTHLDIKVNFKIFITIITIFVNLLYVHVRD
jgi:hypothetical protein